MGKERVYKKIFFDIDAEEEWLQNVTDSGYRLASVENRFFRAKYRFEETDKKYQCRVDYSRDGAVMEEITAPYVMFVKSSCGAEYIGFAGGKVYFRKAEENGDFPPLCSDIQSRIDREKTILRMQLVFMFIFFTFFLSCGVSGIGMILGGRWGVLAALELGCAAIEAIIAAVYGFCAFKTARRIKRMKEVSNM